MVYPKFDNLQALEKTRALNISILLATMVINQLAWIQSDHQVWHRTVLL